jgi:hypothetical protein
MNPEQKYAAVPKPYFEPPPEGYFPNDDETDAVEKDLIKMYPQKTTHLIGDLRHYCDTIISADRPILFQHIPTPYFYAPYMQDGEANYRFSWFENLHRYNGSSYLWASLKPPPNPYDLFHITDQNDQFWLGVLTPLSDDGSVAHLIHIDSVGLVSKNLNAVKLGDTFFKLDIPYIEANQVPLRQLTVRDLKLFTICLSRAITSSIPKP